MLTKILDNLQKKSTINSGVFSSRLLGYGFSQSSLWSWLTPYIAWRYYNSVSPVADACNKIAKEFSNIPVAIQNIKTKEYIKEFDSRIPASEVLNLLKHPNNDVSSGSLQRQIALSFIVTGNNYLIVNARNERSEPLELIWMKPQSVTISRSNFLKHIHTTEEEMSFNFQNSSTDFRMYNKDKTFEIWHTRNFNSDYSVNNPYGRSPLDPIYYEIEQFLNGNIHNNSLLKNGTRPSGVILPDPDSSFSYDDDENYEKLKKEIRNYYQGAGNAGNVLILDGTKDFKELSINNKDMDYGKLKESVAQQIYTNLDIPKPLISEKTMTYSNFKEALFMLYYLNVVPLANFIFEQMTMFLMHRYKGGEDYRITFDLRDIPALQVVQDEQLERLYKLNVINLNEARVLADYEEVGSDGDKYYITQSMTPIDSSNNPEIKKEESKSYFFKEMEQKGMKKEEVNKLWSRYGNII